MPKKTKKDRRKSPARDVQYAREFVVRDPKLLSAVPADFSTITVTQDFAVHSLYQTLLPLGAGEPPNHALECVLVGRYQYGPEILKALVALFIRQYFMLETARGRKNEAFAWLQELLRTQQPPLTPDVR